MPALGTIVTSITQDRFIPRAIDNILSGNVLLERLFRNQRTWRGGVSIEQPVFLTTLGSPGITTVGSYAGFDTFVTTQENTRQRASFTPSQVYCAIPISGIQKAANQGDAAVLDLVATEIDFRTKALRDELGDELYSDGTGNTSKDLLGLLAAVDDNTDVSKMASQSDYMLEQPCIRQYAFA